MVTVQLDSHARHIVGDCLGSPFEHSNLKSTSFRLFGQGTQCTDDSILTVATADVLLNGGDYARAYQDYFHRFPSAGTARVCRLGEPTRKRSIQLLGKRLRHAQLARRLGARHAG